MNLDQEPPSLRLSEVRGDEKQIIIPSPMLALKTFSPPFAWLSVVLWLCSSVAAQPLLAADSIDFNRDIRPLLSDKCFFCHGPDPETREAGLRLDIRDEAIDYGAIVPSDVAASLLVERIDAEDPAMQMPPESSHKSLSDEQRDLLRRWVAEGAPYAEHWSFAAIRRPAVPAVENAQWVKTPVDAFVRRRLESVGANPAETAAAQRLARRLSLDLTGLPPSDAHAPREQIDEFVNDPSDRNYERLVEALLESPHHGERMAVPWLDVVRFADTVGFHGDQNQRIFPYRDWVIAAYNDNMPFDEFTIKQLAGDLLPDPDASTLVATGFNRLNMMTREGGAQPEEYLAKYTADRVRTVGMAWLGLTTGCAECHDHKFDPFKTRDFYSLGAYFADLVQWGVYSDYGYTPNPELAGFTNDHPFPPEIRVHSDYLAARQAQVLEQMVAQATAAAHQQQDVYAGWRKRAAEFAAEHPELWQVAPVEGVHEDVQAFTPHDDGSLTLVDSEKPVDRRSLRIKLPDVPIAAIRLQLLPDPASEGRVLRGTASVDLQVEIAVPDESGQPGKRLVVRRADADLYKPDYVGGEEKLGVESRWRLDEAAIQQPQTSIWQLDQPLASAQHSSLFVTLSGKSVARVRLAVSPLPLLRPFDADWQSQLKEDLDRASPQGAAAIAWALTQDGSQGVGATVRELEQQYRECRDGWAWTMITQHREPREMRVLPRGNWLDKSGEVVQPHTPEFLPGFSDRAGQTRLDLARWIVSPENPLTARVVVNRLWRMFLGTGLSASVDDFGAQGETPSHPELLDWLAAELIDNGWDQRHIIRQIVLSNTYRQSSRFEPADVDRAAAQRMLAFFPPRPLEAEFVRDAALSAAGLLNRQIGGPSAHPYQPPDYYSNLQFPDRTYVADTDDSQYRRGIYMHWQRTFLHPMLTAFDAPSREECVAIRNRSNTPQQALVLLNDPTFVEAARKLAERVCSAAEGDAARIEEAIQQVLARPATEAEQRLLANHLQTQRQLFEGEPQAAERLLQVGISPSASSPPAVELAAWTVVCRTLLNMHEHITVY